MSAVIVAAGVFHMYRDELLQLNMQELYASIRDSVTTDIWSRMESVRQTLPGLMVLYWIGIIFMRSFW